MLVTQQPVLRRFWYALMRMDELDDGPKPFTLLGEKLVIWKNAEGQPAALYDRCCHRTAQLSKGYVENGNIVCGYHGWTYDCSGACVKIPQFTSEKIPPGAKVAAVHCKERYGYVWVALEEPLRDIPEFPEDGAPGYRRIFQFHQHWKTSPVRMMENSFDNSHFSFVHKANFGIFDQPAPSPYEFRDTDYGFEAETRVPVRNPEASFAITGSTAPITERHLINRYYLPFCRRFGCHYSESGIHHIIYNCATPIDDENMILVQWLYRNDSEEACSTQKLIDWDEAITAEDRDILEATDPDACIDTRRRVEFHMPSDKPGLMIRKQLLDLLHAHGEEEIHRGNVPAASA
ncbi:aromatic ring-hydroxylating dioxygenase subunit alpha [Uliginosibacterium sp. H1]|uniref:aromatic ring-hydroxylating dioxygenase subunit alpha n=1 Tax=Uliginosibacterium sp. H1 TaxID=3114757 RepID=UPI002E170754|nr:aromatic ring-hydroxylating dioxygenase subunit alpha [Uliginosibacterium sp. H1]